MCTYMNIFIHVLGCVRFCVFIYNRCESQIATRLATMQIKSAITILALVSATAFTPRPRFHGFAPSPSPCFHCPRVRVAPVQQPPRRVSSRCSWRLSPAMHSSEPTQETRDTSPWTRQLERPVLVLVGCSGAGKRSLGSTLAQRLAVDFVDASALPSETQAQLLLDACHFSTYLQPLTGNGRALIYIYMYIYIYICTYI